MMITTIMAATAETKYMSTTDAGAGVGAVVADGAFITLKAACEYDPQ